MNRYLKIVPAVLLMLAVSCGKKDFNVATAPPDVGGKKDSAKQLIDTLLKMDDSKIVQASAFPGLVCSNEPRLAVATVNVDLNYKAVGENLRISAPPTPLFSTGYYAAPGELISIDVPAGMYQLSAQIGGWTDNVGGITNAPRDPVIYTKQQLGPGRNWLRNLYGGTIYLNAAVPVPAPVTVTLGNVVKSPDFVLGESNDAEWRTRVQNSCVPWLEFRSRFVSFLVPREKCLRIDWSWASVERALTQWDSIIVYDYQGWEGLSVNPADPIDQAPILPYRVVFETAMAPGVAGHSGNPVVVANDDGWFNSILTIGTTRQPSAWGLFHEIGHNNQQSNYWSWSTLGETSNNLFIFKAFERFYRSGLTDTWNMRPELGTDDFPKALDFAAFSGSKDFDGSDTRIDGPFKRLTPFLQLFSYIKPNMPGINNSNYEGWDFMTALYRNARRAPRANLSDLTMHDFVYRSLCDMTKYDWAGFFQAWGISISDLAIEDMGKAYPSIGFKVWEYDPYTRTGGNAIYISDPYNKGNWKIAGFSDQEAVGEGPPNGMAVSLIDNNINTFWHSTWYGAAPPPPHWVAIDLGKKISFSHFTLVQRQNAWGVRPKKVYIDYSNDISSGVSKESNWTTVSGSGYAVDINNLATQTISLGANIYARYVRVRVQSTDDIAGGQVYAAIAEFGVIP